MALQTTVEHVDDPAAVSILTLVGELDASSYEGVIATVREIHEAGAERLLLDLGGLAFLSSSGLVAIHSMLRLMAGEAPPDPEYGWEALRAIHDAADTTPVTGRLRACSAQPGVWKVIDRAGLGSLIPTHPDRASALAAF